MNNLLFYQFGAPNEKDFASCLSGLKREYVVFRREMTDYHADAAFAQEFLQIVHEQGITHVFSYDYFPLISMLCEMNHIPYLSWIFDCPLTTLQSKTVTNACNYIFCFDRLYAERIRLLGAVHCYHLPLGVPTDKLAAMQKQIAARPELAAQYQCECSFVGNLYNEGKNRIRHTDFSAYTKGYLEAVITAQLQLYGANIVYDALSENVVEEIQTRCELKLSDSFFRDTRRLVANAVNKEIAAREREAVLDAVADAMQLSLYTGSNIPERLKEKKTLSVKGYADYDTQMPFVFMESKINLNITSKSIESGIPLRVLDILSVGGFCITNYQPEIAEFFEDGKEIVMYSDMEQMKELICYYLEHEAERRAIADRGYEKVRAAFSLDSKVKEMLDLVR